MSGKKGMRPGQLGLERSTTIHASVKPTKCDLAWAAGFLEGEGCIFTPHGDVVHAVQVNREPLDRLQRFFGGSIVLRKNSTVTGKKIFAWRICGARARGVMQTLFPWFSTHKQFHVWASLNRSARSNVAAATNSRKVG